jgi:hypothetical protein
MGCAGTPARLGGESAAATAACARTRYVLTVHPGTIVANERHSLFIRALADSCGRQMPVRGAHVRLVAYQATTNLSGRCTLYVRLATGRYVVRLYVQGHRVAHTPVSAIPLLSR